MADTFDELPAGDESAAVLLEDAVEYMRANVEGWEPSAGSPDYALLAAGADEDAVQYALLRARADDWARDFGVVFGVADPQLTPATTTTEWTARAGMSAVLTVGTTLVIDAPQGLVPFEVLEPASIAAGGTATGILVQALEAGTAANGATGPVLLDNVPSWVQSVTVEAPAAGGAEALTDDGHLAKIRRAARLGHVAVVHADDLEIAILDVPGIARALVRDNFDVETGNDDQEGVASTFPLDDEGEAITNPAILAQAAELVTGSGRRILNGELKFGEPTYTEIDAAIVVVPVTGFDAAAAEAGVEAAVAAVLDPALHGQPALGEIRRWRMRRNVWRYEVASAADNVDGVDYVQSITLSTSGPGTVNGDGDVVLAGHAPLPRPGTITITIAPPG